MVALTNIRVISFNTNASLRELLGEGEGPALIISYAGDLPDGAVCSWDKIIPLDDSDPIVESALKDFTFILTSRYYGQE